MSDRKAGARRSLAVRAADPLATLSPTKKATVCARFSSRATNVEAAVPGEIFAEIPTLASPH